MARNALDSAAPIRVPLYRTIADAIIRDIRRGRHLEGERLPASRDLARGLEVNRSTVHQALQLLKGEGWIETNKGGGTRVARRSSAFPVLGPAPAWDRIASSLLTRILSEPPVTEPVSVPYDLSRLAPDERDFPAAAFAALLADVARDGSLLAYGSPFGYRPLRETLAERLVKRGIPADPDALLIVNGAQQGLDLITRALVDPGDPVVVETPSYAGALSLFRAHRARLVGVPLDGAGLALAPRTTCFTITQPMSIAGSVVSVATAKSITCRWFTTPSRTAWHGAWNAIGIRKISFARTIRFSISIGNRTT